MPDNQVLDALSEAFLDDHKELAKTIKSTKETPLQDTIQTLSKVERTPSLPVALFGLVAAAKQALLNPGNEAKVTAFWDRAKRFQGLK